MQLFYIPGITGDTAIMDQSESHHCIKVLRKGRGDEVRIVDGSGGMYDGEIVGADPKACTVKILSSVHDFETRDYRLHIAIAPTKNIDRFEWFLEKATEIGIDTITPLICQHSERRRLRYDRLEGILVSAMKQSVKAWKPVLNEMVAFGEFIENDFKHQECFIAHCIDDAERVELLKADCSGNHFLILVGPEGDFAPEEVGMAINKGFQPVSLGNSRLRTETAGVVAAQVISDKISLTR